jgi:hypothetical protein
VALSPGISVLSEILEGTGRLPVTVARLRRNCTDFPILPAYRFGPPDDHRQLKYYLQAVYAEMRGYVNSFLINGWTSFFALGHLLVSNVPNVPFVPLVPLVPLCHDCVQGICGLSCRTDLPYS